MSRQSSRLPPGRVAGKKSDRSRCSATRGGSSRSPADGAAGGDLNAGLATVTDRIAVSDSATLTLARDVRAFFQGNRYLLEPLVRRVVSLVRDPACSRAR